MHNQLQVMASVLGLPETAIGLEGTLGLALPGKDWGNYYGVFYNSSSKNPRSPAKTQSDLPLMQPPFILLPTFDQVGKPNVFAHEWGHALDYHLLDKLGREWHNGLSGKLRGLRQNETAYLQDIESADDPQMRELQLALGNVMNALFFDMDDVVSEIMTLEQEIAKKEMRHVRSGKKLGVDETAVLQSERLQLKRLIEGASRRPLKKSKYKSESIKFAKMIRDNPDYWKKPTEMFARAWEAYVAHRVTKAGAGTDFLGMSDDAYQLTLAEVEGVDARLPMTHPQESERLEIFLALDRLADAIRKTDLFPGDSAAIPNPEIMELGAWSVSSSEGLDPETAGKPVPKTMLGQLARENTRRYRALLNYVENRKGQPDPYADRSAMERTFIKIHDWFLGPAIWVKRSGFFELSRRYKDDPVARAILEDIISRITDDPGGTRKTFSRPEVGAIGIYEEETVIRMRRYANQYKNISERYGMEAMSKDQLLILRKLMTSDPEMLEKAQKGVLGKDMTKLAGLLRKLMDDLYHYAKLSGVDVSYLDVNAYLPRILKTELVFQDPQKFLNETDTPSRETTGAFPLYHNVLWAEQFADEFDNDMELLGKLNALSSQVEFKKLWDGLGSDAPVGVLRKIYKQLKALKKEMDAAEETGESPEGVDLDIDDYLAEKEAEIDQLITDNWDDLSEAFDILRLSWAEAGSSDWLHRINIADAADPSATVPNGRFTKGRVFPKEADSYMAGFYKEPDAAIQDYISQVVRKSEWEKRFGASLVPEGSKKGPNGETLDYLEYLIQEKLSDRMNGDDIITLRSLVQLSTGRQVEQSTMNRRWRAALGSVHAFSLLKMLPRAVQSAVVEPITTGIQAKSTIAGFKAMLLTIEELMPLIAANTDSAQRVRDRRDLATILGLVDDPHVSELMTNRLAGAIAPSWSKQVSEFFRVSGLTGITMASRRSAMVIGAGYITQVAARYLKPAGDTDTSTAKDKTRQEQILSDYGVPTADIPAFSKWVVSQQKPLLGLAELHDTSGSLHEYGRLYANTLNRFIRRSIQDPMRVDRHMSAEGPYGRMVYGIMGFLSAFQRNVLIASVKQTKREWDLTDLKMPKERKQFLQYVGQKTALPFLSLYISHVVFNAFRERLSNPDRWEEMKEKDELAEYLLLMGFSRGGFTGLTDPMFNAISSVKYNTDLVNMLVGAGPAGFAKDAEKIVRVGVVNSENTVSAERQAVSATYNSVLIPLLGAAVSSPVVQIPMRRIPFIGPWTDQVLFSLLQLGTAPRAKHYFSRKVIQGIYGEDPGSATGAGRKRSSTRKRSSSSYADQY